MPVILFFVLAPMVLAIFMPQIFMALMVFLFSPYGLGVIAIAVVVGVIADWYFLRRA